MNRPYLVALAALLAFAVLVAGNVVTSSPTYDETTHLVSGISYWKTGDYRLNPEHPPLVKLVAAATNAGAWDRARAGTLTAPLADEAWAMSLVTIEQTQWRFAHHVVYGLRDETLRALGATPLFVPTTEAIPRTSFLNDPEAMFLRARLTVAVFGVLLGVLVFLWSRDLWGPWGGVASVALFAFDPNFIAHSGIVTTDVAVTLCIFAAVYFLWKQWRVAFVVACALAVLTKFSAVLLAPILIVLAMTRKDRAKSAALGAVALVVSVLAIWTAYRFRYSAAVDPQQAARQEDAVRASLRQQDLASPPAYPRGYFPLREVAEEWAGKRELLGRGLEINDENFAQVRQTLRLGATQRAILFAAERKLLPEAFLFGATWVGSKSMNRASYLKGQRSNTGFRSFYFWTTLYKLPIATLIAIAIGVFLAIRQKITPFVWLPVVLYLAFSLSSNLNIGHRHILPIFPFVYVACGALAKWKPRVAGVLLLATIVATSMAWGRHLAYMNVLGGPDKLSDSNFDWGQDLERLGKWVKANDVREPINLMYFGTADPRWYGIRYHDLMTPDFPAPRQVPGYLAMSSAVTAFDLVPPGRMDMWRRHRKLTRIGTAGDSIFLYRIE